MGGSSGRARRMVVPYSRRPMSMGTDGTTPATIPATHVLVIDDDESLRDLFRDILEGEGYRVTLAASALDTREVARLDPDLMILDLLLGTDALPAWDLVCAIRTDDRVVTLPIVLCSAATEHLSRLQEEIAAMGITVIPKPFELDDFLRAVRRCHRPGMGR